MLSPMAGSAVAEEDREKNWAGGEWQVLIVDDDPDVHVSTEFALGGENFLGRPLKFLHAHSAAEAEDILRKNGGVAVILLDVVMETPDAGLRLARTIRDELGLLTARIILRTGHPGYAPEHDIIRDYDIDDYRTKSELSRVRLFTSVITALRAFDRIRQLREANQSMERLTRDLELLNVDYLEQREAALPAAQAKAQFLQNVSHELRTPLNAIVGFSELSLRALNEGRAIERSYLEDILEAGRRLTALVGDILDFSQLSSKSRRLLIEPVNVSELVRFNDEIYRPLADRLGVELVALDHDRDTVCELDRGSVSKVLGHVLSNALRYSPKGSRVEMEWRFADSSLMISISDRGPGIPKAIRENLDEPFEIGQDVLTKNASGLGPGLTICRQLMMIMRGYLSIEDREGGGTRITLHLPNLTQR